MLLEVCLQLLRAPYHSCASETPATPMHLHLCRRAACRLLESTLPVCNSPNKTESAVKFMTTGLWTGWSYTSHSAVYQTKPAHKENKSPPQYSYYSLFLFLVFLFPFIETPSFILLCYIPHLQSTLDHFLRAAISPEM